MTDFSRRPRRRLTTRILVLLLTVWVGLDLCAPRTGPAPGPISELAVSTASSPSGAQGARHGHCPLRAAASADGIAGCAPAQIPTLDPPAPLACAEEPALWGIAPEPPPHVPKTT